MKTVFFDIDTQLTGDHSGAVPAINFHQQGIIDILACCCPVIGQHRLLGLCFLGCKGGPSAAAFKNIVRADKLLDMVARFLREIRLEIPEVFAARLADRVLYAVNAAIIRSHYQQPVAKCAVQVFHQQRGSPGY